jgi:hypothetical protein
MCNAAKHSPGCTCGFGPPYLAGYSPTNVTEWALEVLDRPELARRGLIDMSWDDKSINEFLQLYLQVRNSDLPRQTQVARIRELLGLRKKVEEQVTEEWINVPLYRFGAPPVKGAKVEYSEGEHVAKSAGWLVKVFGVGSGDTTTLQVNKSKTFVAESGSCKIVLVPVKLRVARIAVYDNNRLIGRGYDAQVAPIADGDNHLKGRICRSAPAGGCVSGPTEGAEVLDLGLSGDTSSAIHHDTRTWESNVSSEISLKLGKLVNVSALVSVKRSRRLQLSFALPSGYDYLGYLCAGVTWWKRPATSAH